MEKIKEFVREHEKLMIVIAKIYNLFGMNLTKGYKNLVYKKCGAFLFKSKVFNYGKNNTLIFEKGCRVYNSKIQFYGNYNSVVIDKDCVLKDVDIWISDGSFVEIGHNTHFAGYIHIACTEGKKVHIGKRCLFSNQVTLRTGDSHSIIDSAGLRMNYAKDVYIGDHVWVGNQVIILKGSEVESDSVIGTGALVTENKFPKGSILAGVPAKVIKNDITWNHRLL